MRRREFIRLVAGPALASPLTARAQQVALPVVGILSSSSLDPSLLVAFGRGLSEQGYIEGRNVRLEYRDANGQYDRLPAQAAELVSLRVAVIAAVGSSPSAIAAKAATSRIPIVFYLGVDPVEIGLVASYHSPGGNVTGVCAWQESTTPKILELLHELLPRPATFAFMINPNNGAAKKRAERAQDAADDLGRNLIVVGAGTEGQIDQAYEILAQQRAGGLVVDQEAFFVGRRHQIVSLEERHKLPTLFASRLFAEAGGFMSYASSISELYFQTGTYVGKVLNGISTTNLPVLQPTKYELIINLKTAKMLSLNVPPSLLARADEVIE
jgi:putative tryptophan/tyrosine transport system substrate-binding protein